MLRQSVNQTFMLMLLTVLLSLCSLSAFSGGTKQIQILHKTGNDKDTYTVTAKSAGGQCVDSVSPWFVEAAPGNKEKPPIIDIVYLSSADNCALYQSTQLFVVRSKEHPERIARFWWIKGIGTAPYVTLPTDYGWDRYGLLSIDNSKSDKIKVWIGYGGQSN